MPRPSSASNEDFGVKKKPRPCRVFCDRVGTLAWNLRRRGRVPLRLAVECILAFLGAEMIFPSAIFRVEVGLLLVDVHLANWISGHERPPGCESQE